MALRKKKFEVENFKMLFVAMALILAFAVQYSESYYGSLEVIQASSPVVKASNGDWAVSFKIGQCDQSVMVYGWGNRSVGMEGAPPDFGCFDHQGAKLEGIFDERSCVLKICS